MDTLFAVKGKDFVVVASDCYASYSIIRLKDTDDKIFTIDDNKLMAVGGPTGDRVQFAEYVRRNVHLHRLRHTVALSTAATANFARSELARILRSSPMQVDILLAGYDVEGPKLFWIDWLASMVEVNVAAHGYGGHFLWGLLDRYFKPEMTEEEALSITNKCIQELKNRFLISQSNFVIKIVRKDACVSVSD